MAKHNLIIFLNQTNHESENQFQLHLQDNLANAVRWYSQSRWATKDSLFLPYIGTLQEEGMAVNKMHPLGSLKAVAMVFSKMPASSQWYFVQMRTFISWHNTPRHNV